jgi:cysteine synthase
MGLMARGQDAKNYVKTLAQSEGLFVGISSGANVLAALRIAEEIETEITAKSPTKKTIVTVLLDSQEHYLSMNIFS